MAMMRKSLLIGVSLGVGGLLGLAVLKGKGRRRVAYCRNGSVSRRRARKAFVERGHDLVEQDVCHIIAKSHGGPNHVDNLFPCPSSLNRSVGNRDDGLMLLLAGPQRAARAKRAHRLCGRRFQ